METDLDMREPLIYKEKILFSNGDVKLHIESYKHSNIASSQLFHEEIEIKLFYEGSSTILINTNNITAHAGDIVFVNPYDIHSTVSIGDKSGKYHLFVISIDFFSNTGIRDFDLRQIFIKQQISIQHLIRNDERLNSILLNILSSYKTQSMYRKTLLNGLLLEFFALLFDNYTVSKQKSYISDKSTRYYSIVAPALIWIREHYAEKITLDFLSALCNISKHHFCRIFKSITNTTVSQYIILYRLQMANIELQFSNNSIAEIAHSCGFEDIGYFSKCFKKQFGVSPYNQRMLYQNKGD